MLENNPMAYYFQPKNAIQVRPWTGDKTDTELFDIIPILKDLKDVEDVRLSLGDATTRFVVKSQLADQSIISSQSAVDADGPVDSCSDLNKGI